MRQRPDFLYGILKRAGGEVFGQFRILPPDLLAGKLGLVPDQFVYRYIKISGQLRQKQKIRRIDPRFP